MAIVPAAIVREQRIAEAVSAAEQQLRPDVIRIRFEIGEDWTGDPSVFFKIVLTDEAASRANLLRSAQRAEAVVRERVEPEENFGLLAYFNYRSQSEMDELKGKDPRWA